MKGTPSAEAPVYALLRNSDLLKGLTASQAAKVLAAGRFCTAAEGQQIFCQGASAVRFYALVSGRLKIVQTTPEGEQIIAHWVEPGQVFGLAIAIGREDYPATALAATQSTMIAWPSTSWPRLAGLYPPFAEQALRTIGGRLQDAMARLGEVGSTRVDQRVARALLRLARQSGRPTTEGVEIDFPITRKDIAELTSTTLYTVSRILSAWEQAGIIAGRRRRIEILDAAALTRIAGES